MKSIVELKKRVKDKVHESYNENVVIDEVYISICIEHELCVIEVDSDSIECNLDYIILLWEILALQDGYFYEVINYKIDGKNIDVSELYFLNLRKTDSKFVVNSFALCNGNRCLSGDSISKYRDVRTKGRACESMNESMFSAYFYIISEDYSKIMIEHRLVLLEHICDGVSLAFFNGNAGNNVGNVNSILNKFCPRIFKEIIKMLGGTKNSVKNAIGNTRNELTHWNYKSISFGSWIEQDGMDAMIYWVIVYILFNSIRTSLLEVIGIYIDESVRENIMTTINDWIIYEKYLDKECKTPLYRFLQSCRKFNSDIKG